MKFCKGIRCYFGVFALIAFLSGPAQADIPQQISHQGVVSVNGVRFNGDGTFYFALVASGGAGNNLWTNDGTEIGSSNRPATGAHISVDNGIYSIRLGGETTTPIEPTVFNNADIALRIWFNDGSNEIQQLLPDQLLSATAFTFHAATADFADAAKDAERVGGVLAGQAGSFVGMIVPFFHPALVQVSPPNLYDLIPDNWVVCDGRTLNEAHPSGLAIGEVDPIFWGTVLPDLRDRFPRGVPNNQPTQLGAVGGSYSSNSGNAFAASGISRRGEAWRANGAVGRIGSFQDEALEGGHVHSVSAIPPYYTVYYLIRIK